MFLSDAEREALLRVGATVDRQGRFDHKASFVDDQVIILLALQDKKLVRHEHEAFYLTPAGLEELQKVRQATEESIERARETRKAKYLECCQAIVLALIGGLITWFFSQFSE